MKRYKGWEVQDGDKRVNVLPLDDLRDHRDSFICECTPVVEHYAAKSLVIHNAFDGRLVQENDWKYSLQPLSTRSN